MKKEAKVIIWLAVLIYALAGLGMQRYAYDASRYGCPDLTALWFQNIKVRIEVLPDGSLSVSERWVVPLKSDVRSLYRYFVVDGYEGITDFSAYEKLEDGYKRLDVKAVKLAGSIGYKFSFEGRNGTREFVLNYTAVSAVWRSDGGSELIWSPFPTEGIFADGASVTFSLPVNASVEVFTEGKEPESQEVWFEGGRTYVRIRYFGRLSGVKVRLLFKPGVATETSVKKLMSRSPGYWLASTAILVLSLLSVLGSAVMTRRTVYVEPRRVMEELDAVEFFFLARGAEDDVAAAALLQLFVDGSIGLSVTPEGVRIRPKKREPDVKWLKVAREAALEKPFSFERVAEAVCALESDIYLSLKGKGYVRRARRERDEPESSIFTVFAAIVSLIALALQLAGAYYAYPVLFVPSVGVLLIATFLARAKDFRTPKGRGAVVYLREELRDAVEGMKKEIKKEQLALVFERGLPYLAAFREIAKGLYELRGMVFKGWVPRYVEKKKERVFRLGEVVDVLQELLG